MHPLAALKSFFSAPAPSTSRSSRQSLDAGARRGSLSSWQTHRLHDADSVVRERVLSARRAEDLYANDWAARSGINDICLNTIGAGLVPQVKLPHKLLGIERAQAAALQEQMEWAFALWSGEAHVKGLHRFEGLQYAALRSVLRTGECFHLPVALPQDSRHFSLAIQDIAPARIMTPLDLRNDPAIRDGVRLNAYGAPQGYYLATPSPTNSTTPLDYSSLSSADFSYRPAQIGHRPNVFHLFRCEDEEQVRGISALAPGMKMFRNLADCIDYELFAQVIAAAFPIFVETEGGSALDAAQEMFGIQQNSDPVAPDIQINLSEGGITFGKPGQKPHILESKRPSANFAAFTEIVLRSLSASLGTSYESLTKDFTKANYSAARAAMNEAWKLYTFYRKWFAPQYCQPIFEMVMEEAFLRGMVDFPTSLDDFYARRQLWCNASWIGPARGFVDPVKEVQSIVMRLQNKLMTYEDAWAESGADFDEGLETMTEEHSRLAGLAVDKA